MAGTIIESQLTTPIASLVRFALATEKDDAAIRRLLRENPMAGEIRLAFEREPDYFRSTQMANADSKTILGFLHEQLIGIGRCSFRNCFANGKMRRVGYLSELRLDANAQGRFDILRRGYQFFRELHRDDPADFYFTSIAADNERSIRLLERGLPGMPAYKFAADFVTLLIPVPRNARGNKGNNELASHGFKCVAGSRALAGELVSCLNSHAEQNQLAAFWTETDLLSLENFGLALSDFRVVLGKNDSIVACTALWDQRHFKQIVVRGYARQISVARPLINLLAKLFGTMHLPAVDTTLAFGFISFVCCSDPQLLATLIKAILPVATERGLEFLTLGFASNDSRLPIIRGQFRCREYRTRLYQVIWDEADELILDTRPFLPEVALL